MVNHNTPQFSLKENYLIHQNTGPSTGPKKALAKLVSVVEKKDPYESTEKFKKDIKKDIDALDKLKKIYKVKKKAGSKISENYMKDIAKLTKDILSRLAQVDKTGRIDAKKSNKKIHPSSLDAIANKEIKKYEDIPTLKIEGDSIIVSDIDDTTQDFDDNKHKKTITITFFDGEAPEKIKDTIAKDEDIKLSDKESIEYKGKKEKKIKELIQESLGEREYIEKYSKDQESQKNVLEALEERTSATLKGLIKTFGQHKAGPIQAVLDQYTKKRENPNLKPADIPIIEIEDEKVLKKSIRMVPKTLTKGENVKIDLIKQKAIEIKTNKIIAKKTAEKGGIFVPLNDEERAEVNKAGDDAVAKELAKKQYKREKTKWIKRRTGFTKFIIRYGKKVVCEGKFKHKGKEVTYMRNSSQPNQTIVDSKEGELDRLAEKRVLSMNARKVQKEAKKLALEAGEKEEEAEKLSKKAYTTYIDAITQGDTAKDAKKLALGELITRVKKLVLLEKHKK